MHTLKSELMHAVNVSTLEAQAHTSNAVMCVSVNVDPDVFLDRSLAWKSPCITPECWRTANSGSTTCPSDVEISSASSERSAAPRANG